MSKVHSGKSLLSIAKEAATTVVNTLNPNDRLGIVGFSSESYTPKISEKSCFETNLAKASPQNKKDLKSFISNLTAGGATRYDKGLEKAFMFFRNSQEILSQSEYSKKIKITKHYLM